MIVIPAIDLKEGRVVRLTRGEFEQETIYDSSPSSVLQKWQEEGAKLIHVVDLEGARDGILKNLESVKSMLRIASVPIQFGGGLRHFRDVSTVLELGVACVVIGTKAFDQPLIQKLVDTFKERIAVGLDLRKNAIQTHGWRSQNTNESPEHFCRKLEQMGVQTVIVTDVSRDGTLEGPNVPLLQNMLNATGIDIILSGGVGSLSHLGQLTKIRDGHFKGVIIGKALYEHQFTLSEAIQYVKGIDA